MQSFWAELRTQRWDDHRFYHHSRINQSLHFLSALSFIVAYLMMFKDPVMAALIGWLIAMVSRQSGHFFFEPKGYDDVNAATHEHKEDIKVGYNLRRKIPSAQRRRVDVSFYGPSGSQHVTIYRGQGQMLEAPDIGLKVRVAPVRTGGMTPYVVRYIEY